MPIFMSVVLFKALPRCWVWVEQAAGLRHYWAVAQGCDPAARYCELHKLGHC